MLVLVEQRGSSKYSEQPVQISRPEIHDNLCMYCELNPVVLRTSIPHFPFRQPYSVPCSKMIQNLGRDNDI